MTNPNTSGIPGMGAMTDTFDFMKNLWSGMSMPGLPGMKIPGMVMPTLSVEEINKQITDLKSVESWLTMNLTMLHGTIQALEVQSATITAIQSVSESMASAMKPNLKPDAESTSNRPGKPIFESPFVAPQGAATAEQKQASTTPEKATSNSSGEEPGAATSNDSSPLVPPMANAAAWWGMLQDQFKQAVDTAAAMAPDAPAASGTKAASTNGSADSATSPATSTEPKSVKSASAKSAPKTPSKNKKD